MPKATQNPRDLAQIVSKRRWTSKDATDVVTAWRRSDLSQRAFCKQHGIDSPRLARWAKLIPEAPAFVEAVVVSKSVASSPPIIVELGAARIVIGHEVEDDHLARVLRIVGSVC
jgi:hypothetical protein